MDSLYLVQLLLMLQEQQLEVPLMLLEDFLEDLILLILKTDLDLLRHLIWCHF